MSAVQFNSGNDFDPSLDPEGGQADNGHKLWVDALMMVANHYRLSISPQSIQQASAWQKTDNQDVRLRDVARRCGLNLKLVPVDEAVFSSWLLPLVFELDTGEVGVILTLSANGKAGVVFMNGAGMVTPVKLNDLRPSFKTLAFARPMQIVADSRVDNYIKPYERHWLRAIILRDLRPYTHVMVGSFVANSMGLAGVIFSMQVYDRVVPTKSLPTLFVLFSGVMLALVIEFVVRKLRATIIDLLGKRSDLRISDQVMGHALRVQNAARPKSTGTFISQLREVESVREMLTSTTIAALSDMPYFLMFLLVFWMIGGSLVLIPLAGLLLMIIPGLLMQRRLKNYASLGMRESSLRSAMLVEAVQGIEDIKILQAEDRFQQMWNQVNSVSAEANIKIRGLQSTLNTLTQSAMGGVFATTILVGAPMVIAGNLTTGTLVAASILGSRMLAPMAPLAGLLTRLQQAKIAANGLDQLMKLPIDSPPSEKRVHIANILGTFKLQGLRYRYGDQSAPLALQVSNLVIHANEKIAIVGRNGAGKSTLLKALSGLIVPERGTVMIDGLAMRHVDPSDIRRDITYLSQNARLFHGTLRDNLLMGAPQAVQSDIARALEISCAVDFITKLPKGMDHLVNEGGESLSGGQRQSILLARTIIRDPHVILLDEPTASMDESTERSFLKAFQEWSTLKTVVISTHRTALLQLVDRIIVVDDGKIVLDDTKDNVLKKLRSAGSGEQ
jgi:ATP-binding cassette subfamily C protein LapB